MEVIILMLVTFFGYLLAYHTYGKFLAQKVFNLSNSNPVPSQELQDGVDYVPTNKNIIFGHHYTSIAGTGPIVGPAIGIIWGWVPALIWIFLGSIVMGAVHDFGALVISLRHQGMSVSEIAKKYLGNRVRYIFFLIVFFELLVVVAIFGMIIAVIFKMYPQAVFPVWMEIPIAILLGMAVYRWKKGLLLSTFIAVTAMYITVILGHFLPFTLPSLGPISATGGWTIILLIYAFIASTLPVTTLLQPRDYINAWQLYVAMGLMVLGILASGLFANLTLVAPAFNLKAAGAPPVLPFIFITIACGAISGFHCLVSSGTSSKQVAKESDAQYVGYGAMLMEAVLATIVLIGVGAGIGMLYNVSLPSGEIIKTLSGTEAWQAHYSSWQASAGLGSKINAVVIGMANMIGTLGVPRHLAIIVVGVFIASFAGTTLDSATRIQRYVVAELFRDIKCDFMANKYWATLFAVGTAAILAFVTGADGAGALTLWPLFGAINQLLAALALILITVYLKKQKGGAYYLLAAFPTVFMLIMTIWSMCLNQINFINTQKYLLGTINIISMLLALWMLVESLLVTFGKKQKDN